MAQPRAQSMRLPSVFLRAQAPVGRAVTLFLAILLVACATPELEKDNAYPADWPDLVAAGEDCRGIEGTFANQGVPVDRSGRRTEVLFTDLFGPRANAEQEKFLALRSCERVSLRVETYPSQRVMRSRLIVEASRKITSDPLGRYELCESLHLPRDKGWPFADQSTPRHESGAGYCFKNHLQYSRPEAWGGKRPAPRTCERWITDH